MAIPNEVIWVINILGPKWSKMIKANGKPWFWLAIVVNNCSILHILDVGVVLVTQTKHVPGWVNRVNMTLECNQGRRQGTQFPHCEVWLQVLHREGHKIYLYQIPGNHNNLRIAF